MNERYFDLMQHDWQVPMSVKLEAGRLWKLAKDGATSAIRCDAQHQLDALVKRQRETLQKRRTNRVRDAASQSETRQSERSQSREPRPRASLTRLNAQLSGLRKDIQQLLKEKSDDGKGP